MWCYANEWVQQRIFFEAEWRIYNNGLRDLEKTECCTKQYFKKSPSGKDFIVVRISLLSTATSTSSKTLDWELTDTWVAFVFALRNVLMPFYCYTTSSITVKNSTALDSYHSVIEIKRVVSFIDSGYSFWPKKSLQIQIAMKLVHLHKLLDL